MLEPEEEERQKKMAMMKKYYRNRQATFIKQLLKRKEEHQKAEEEKREKDEKRKKKIKDKALANMNMRVDANAEINPDELPPIERPLRDDQLIRSAERKRFTRGNSVAAFGGTSTRGLSLSARPSDFQVNKAKSKNQTQEDFSTEPSQKSGIPRIPRSRKQKHRQMVNAYGVSDHDDTKKLVRQNSRTSCRSVRSSHSL